MASNQETAYQAFIDQELAEASATEWMAAGEGQVRYGEGKEAEIASLQTTGLGDYDSTKTDGTAYPAGAVTSKWKSHTMAMDRGVKFALDHSAPEDMTFPATVENVIRQFARTQLAREQDAYRIQKLYALAAADEKYKTTHVLEFDGKTDDIIEELSGLVQTLETDSERTGGFVALVASDLKTQFLQASADSYHSVAFEQEVEINGMTYSHVMMLNDMPCIFVPAGRMKTAIAVQSGRGEESGGGIKPGTGAKSICALVTACDAPLALSRIDSLKQFGPEENQLFDGTAIQARYLYDLVVPEDRVVSIGALVAKA